MAAPKKPASTAVATRKSSAVGAAGSWKDKLAQYAKAAVAVADETGGGGQFVSAKAGQLSVNGSPCAGNQLDVIVLESVMENAYYGRDYDPDNPQPPICYAFGRSLDEMAPHEKSSEPQHDQCKGCPHNEFGTADKGKGKACKNIMRLALAPAKPLTAEAIDKSEVMYFKTPVTSVKSFANYTKRLATLHSLPPFAFVTRISTQPDAKTQFKVLFEDVEEIDDDLMELIVAKHEEQVEAIAFPYALPAEEEAPKAKPKAGAKKKY